VTKSEAITTVLRTTGRPLLVSDIASAASMDEVDVDRILWSDPDRFLWQPGHKWTINAGRARPTHDQPKVETDTRVRPLAQAPPKQLRALTLSNGVSLKVTKYPTDSDAPFSVRSAGDSIELQLNTAHELFRKLPVPFDDNDDEPGYKRLAEVLLAAWVVYEDSIPGDLERRSATDARHMWGRSTIDALGLI
jgi:hypothetical protein